MTSTPARETYNGSLHGNSRDTPGITNCTHNHSKSSQTIMAATKPYIIGKRPYISTVFNSSANILTWRSCEVGIAVMGFSGPLLLHCLGFGSLVASCWLMSSSLQSSLDTICSTRKPIRGHKWSTCFLDRSVRPYHIDLCQADVHDHMFWSTSSWTGVCTFDQVFKVIWPNVFTSWGHVTTQKDKQL